MLRTLSVAAVMAAAEGKVGAENFPGEDIICKLASSEMIKEKSTGEICKLIEKKFPKLPDQECTVLLDKIWDKIVAKCPPNEKAPEECPNPGSGVWPDSCNTNPCCPGYECVERHYAGDDEKVCQKKKQPVAAADGPCCNKACEAPMVKMFSVDAAHGFCGESCMDPKKFSIYKKFEANLTIAEDGDIHPCSKLLTPSNTRRYTDYFQTVTHGFPGLLTVTLDLYAPYEMPDHSCCSVPLIQSLNCVGIPGKPKSMSIFGTGPYCCPSGATEETPCSTNTSSNVVV